VIPGSGVFTDAVGNFQKTQSMWDCQMNCNRYNEAYGQHRCQRWNYNYVTHSCYLRTYNSSEAHPTMDIQGRVFDLTFEEAIRRERTDWWTSGTMTYPYQDCANITQKGTYAQRRGETFDVQIYQNGLPIFVGPLRVTTSTPTLGAHCIGWVFVDCEEKAGNCNLNEVYSSRRWKATLQEAKVDCQQLPDCTGITRDNNGFEARKGRAESFSAAKKLWKCVPAAGVWENPTSTKKASCHNTLAKFQGNIGLEACKKRCQEDRWCESIYGALDAGDKSCFTCPSYEPKYNEDETYKAIRYDRTAFMDYVGKPISSNAHAYLDPESEYVKVWKAMGHGSEPFSTAGNQNSWICPGSAERSKAALKSASASSTIRRLQGQ